MNLSKIPHLFILIFFLGCGHISFIQAKPTDNSLWLKTVNPHRQNSDPFKKKLAFFAPQQFKHPLKNSKNLIFMIGEDTKGFYLYGEGAINAGAYEKFLKYVEHYKLLGINLNRLMLHSPGGILHEGIKIGQYVHNNRWTMDADRYMRCYSACGFIYVAGVQKRLQNGAEIGFHRPYSAQKKDTPEIIASIYREYQAYWQRIQGSTILYDKFMRGYGRDDMYILNNKNIKNYIQVEKYE